MKKYSKLIVLLIVITVTFSIYYLEENTLSEAFAQFHMKTIEGDEAIEEQVVIKGDFYSSYNTGEVFKITQQGTHYLRDESFFDRMDAYYIPEKVKQLQQENRRFMRMKSEDHNAYVETEDMIIYADIPYTRWGVLKGYVEVETYNRDTKETHRYEIDAPELVDYSMIENVYIRDNHLYISVLNMSYDVAAEQDRTLVYVFDFNLEKETLDETYKITMEELFDYSEMTKVFVDDENNPTKMLISGTGIEYETIENQEKTFSESPENEGEEIDEEIIGFQRLKTIDLQTGKTSNISLDQIEKNSIPIGYTGDEIVFVQIDRNSLVYHLYDIATQQVTKTLPIEIKANYISLWDLEENIINDHHVYTLINHDAENRGTLIAVDMKSLELTYKGIVEPKAHKQSMKDPIDVYFHTLEIRE